MEKSKYKPEEIDRIIAEEISRIDASNSLVEDDAVRRRKTASPSPLRRIFSFLCPWCRRGKHIL